MTRATQARELGISTTSLTAMFARLDKLSRLGANMYVAYMPLMREFGLCRRDAGQVVRAWMQEN